VPTTPTDDPPGVVGSARSASMGASIESGESVEAVADQDGEAEVARLLRRPESLRCVYQPVVDLRTGECAGYEALTRVADWPARSPQPWFAAAARTGLAGQLEAATLGNALRGRAELGPEQFLAVNVAAAFLDDSSVVTVLREQKELTGLVVELVWPDGASGQAGDAGPTGAMAALRVEGLRIACDVVEAGRGELERLHRVQPDLIKLDAGLVKGAHDDPVRDRLIRLVISMAESMGAVVQAEGVESLDDARHMQVVGARLAQGWLFGRARPSLMPPAPEVSTWLRATWEETMTLSRAGRLARPLPTAIGRRESGDPAQWHASLDGDGRLVALIDPSGESIAASRLLRLRASQDLRSAALRVLASTGERRELGMLVIADEDGRFVGVTDLDALMREVLGESR
jgi:EAL domain-containing protein (putative c-di-GMP-specific phosphodiesterase class I)